MNAEEKNKLEDFREAKKIALTISEGEMRLAKRNGQITHFYGANVGGRMFVVGETEEEIQNPDAIIQGMPAREVFGEFTVMNGK